MRERWKIVVQGKSCSVEWIGFGIGEEGCMVIGEVNDMVSCMEGCRVSGVRIGWRIGSLGGVVVVGGFLEVVVVVVLAFLVEPDAVVVDIVAVVEVQGLKQAEMEH